MTDRAAADRWLQAYVDAWRSYDPEAIAALFTDDIVYRYHPYDEPITGREAVVRSWLGEAGRGVASEVDPPDTYEARYRVVAVDGDVVVATGTTDYRDRADGPVVRTYDNCFVMRLSADGRCAEFTEWFILRPQPHS